MKIKQKVLLKDEVVKKIFTSGSKASKDYMLSIISEITKIPINDLKNDFELLHPKVGMNKNIINSELDLVAENKDNYFSFEFNYSKYTGLEVKNFTYLCQLYLRDVKHKKDYENIKKIWQFSIDNYDYYGDNKFLYISEMLERNSHKSRNVGIYLVDINLDYLDKIDYNGIKEGNYLEKLLYIFVCNDDDILDKLYKGDRIMSEVRKEIKRLDEPFDEILYYDKEALDKKIKEWETDRMVRKEVALEMLHRNMNVKTIMEISKLPKDEIEKLKNTLQEEKE